MRLSRDRTISNRTTSWSDDFVVAPSAKIIWFVGFCYDLWDFRRRRDDEVVWRRSRRFEIAFLEVILVSKLYKKHQIRKLRVRRIWFRRREVLRIRLSRDMVISKTIRLWWPAFSKKRFSHEFSLINSGIWSVTAWQKGRFPIHVSSDFIGI